MNAIERYSVERILFPIDVVTSLNLKTATAAARVARYAIPPSALMTRTNNFQHGWEIMGHGWVADGAGGAITTAAVLALYVTPSGGVAAESSVNTPAGVATNWSRITIPASMADGAVLCSTVESVVYTNPPAQLTASQPGTYFPTVQAAVGATGADIVETYLVTQGAGAGAMTGRPFLIVRSRLLPAS